MIYLIPRPQDKLQKSGRETGWRHVRMDRDGRKELANHARELKGRGITAVYVCDLDIECGEVVRDELDCTVRSEFPLRRFNPGRYHGSDHSKVDEILRGLSKKWEANPDIPIHRGDSLTSFKKRFVKRYEQILAENTTVAMVVDERTLAVIRDMSQQKFSPSSIVPNGNAPRMDRIYKVESNAARG